MHRRVVAGLLQLKMFFDDSRADVHYLARDVVFNRFLGLLEDRQLQHVLLGFLADVGSHRHLRFRLWLLFLRCGLGAGDLLYRGSERGVDAICFLGGVESKENYDGFEFVILCTLKKVKD